TGPTAKSRSFWACAPAGSARLELIVQAGAHAGAHPFQLLPVRRGRAPARQILADLSYPPGDRRIGRRQGLIDLVDAAYDLLGDGPLDAVGPFLLHALAELDPDVRSVIKDCDPSLVDAVDLLCDLPGVLRLARRIALRVDGVAPQLDQVGALLVARLPRSGSARHRPHKHRQRGSQHPPPFPVHTATSGEKHRVSGRRMSQISAEESSIT